MSQRATCVDPPESLMRGSNPTIEAVPALGNASICFLGVGPALVALVVFLATLLTLDPAGDRPNLPQGPGLTTDEVLNVEAGLVLWHDLKSYGWGLLDPTSWYEVYSTPHYQPDYPPLGRLALAAGHEAAQSLWPVPTDPTQPPRSYYTVQARTVSAWAFALTVFLVGWYTSRWSGRFAGTCAALSLPLMPRLFAHAHIASIESLVGLFFIWTVLATVDRWPQAMSQWNNSPIPRSRWSIPWKPVVITGLLLGLTLLTKIQAILFPIPFSLWAVWRFGRRGVTAVAAVGAISACVLFVGWPWLWIDPLQHAKAYFLPAGRDHLYCWYEGQRFLDSDVPWHYPFVLFAVTVPVGLHLLGAWGTVSGLKCLKTAASSNRSGMDLLLTVMAFPLILFALPKVTVYDGERLFLVSFPLWGVLIGQGAASLKEWLAGRSDPLAEAAPSRWLRRTFALPVIALLFLSEAYTLVTLHPCQLSYYSWTVGGLRGADSLGLERTYWGDSITRALHQQIVSLIPAGSTVHVAPVLHPLQLPGMALQSPLLQQHQIQLDAYDDSIRDQVKYVLVYRRQADPRTSLDEPTDPSQTAPPGMRLLAEVRREGVQLAALYSLDK